ncbi:MAG: cell division protein ZapA [Clostridia bacterium]|nr:cell division protein ZapA [Clostridia bacterium]MBQ5760652.1 cell division protein ZapA [Clostridia bacterium]
MQRVNVTIDGKTYTIVSEDDENHIRRSAELVDKCIGETKQNGRLSSVDGAILAAMNIADKYFKAQQSSDNMRAQIRSYADECAQLRSEIIKLKKQNKEG